VPTDLTVASWPIHTARLTIRPASPADVEATWRFRRLPAVDQWLSSRSSTVEEYRTRFTDPDRMSKTLVVELDGTVIGDLMLAVQDAWAQNEVQDQARGVQAELGWCLDPAHHGHGYGTEAVGELLRICFADLGLRRITATCFANNTASWRLMERLHLRREEHTIRDSLHRTGQWLDGYRYALLADEWHRAAEHWSCRAVPQPTE
jgi:RimJ/RimL family protein N-acetyltransferase